MAKPSNPGANEDLANLARSIARDAGKLFSQHVDLLRAEMSQEMRRAAGAALSLAAGGGLAAVGGLFVNLMLAHLMQRTTRLPLWCCYGLVGGGCATAGMALLRQGQARLTDVRLLPTQTVAAVEENLTWLKEQLHPAAH